MKAPASDVSSLLKECYSEGGKLRDCRLFPLPVISWSLIAVYKQKKDKIMSQIIDEDCRLIFAQIIISSGTK